MRTCPRCGAVAFDDALVCYGCLYRFEAMEVEACDSFAQSDPSSADEGSELVGAELVDAELVGEEVLEPEPELELASEPKPELELEPEPEPKLDPEPEFEQEAKLEPKPEPEPEPLRKRMPLVAPQSPVNQDPPEFCIHLTPRHNAWGGWKWDCSVEIEEKVQHEVIGRHAVQVH